MLYPLQDGHTPLYLAVYSDLDLFDYVEYLLSNSDIDVNSDLVSWSTRTCARHCYMFAGLLYPPLQNGWSLLYYAAREGHTACVERILSTPGIDVDTAFQDLLELDHIEKLPIHQWYRPSLFSD